MADVAKPAPPPHPPAASAGATHGDSVQVPPVSADERGKTTIAVAVVEKIAGMAAREVDGVFALGGPGRGFGGMRDRVGGGGKPAVARGVKAEVGERQAALDIELVVEYGVPIPKLAAAVRTNVIGAVETSTGLEVVEVNIAVNDVRLPDELSEDEAGSRVQ